MYQVLMAMLTKPPLYQKTICPFWEDEHISKGMLKAHLDPATDAASWKPDTIARSADWIGRLVQAGAALLDLGCGPGLYARLFARQGLQVTGRIFPSVPLPGRRRTMHPAPIR